MELLCIWTMASSVRAHADGTGFFRHPGSGMRASFWQTQALFQPATGRDNSHFLYSTLRELAYAKLKLNEQAIPNPDCSELETFRKDFILDQPGLCHGQHECRPVCLATPCSYRQGRRLLDDPVVSLSPMSPVQDLPVCSMVCWAALKAL